MQSIVTKNNWGRKCLFSCIACSEQVKSGQELKADAETRTMGEFCGIALSFPKSKARTHKIKRETEVMGIVSGAYFCKIFKKKNI